MDHLKREACAVILAMTASIPSRSFVSPNRSDLVLLADTKREYRLLS